MKVRRCFRPDFRGVVDERPAIVGGRWSIEKDHLGLGQIRDHEIAEFMQGIDDERPEFVGAEGNDLED